jgi:hypothetical protein
MKKKTVIYGLLLMVFGFFLSCRDSEFPFVVYTEEMTTNDRTVRALGNPLAIYLKKYEGYYVYDVYDPNRRKDTIHNATLTITDISPSHIVLGVPPRQNEIGYANNWYNYVTDLNADTLTYRKSMGGSYKNGYYTIMIIRSKNLIRTNICTYYGVEVCDDGYYKID